MAKRGLDYANMMGYAKGDTEYAKKLRETVLWNYILGDVTQENTSARIASGVDTLILEDELKNRNGDDILGITRQKEGNGNGRIIQLEDHENINNVVVALGHESYRDGVVRDDNYLETRKAVLGHTEMAERMLMAGKNITPTEALLNDHFVYNLARMLNDMSIMDRYADMAYNSDEDYDNYDPSRWHPILSLDPKAGGEYSIQNPEEALKTLEYLVNKNGLMNKPYVDYKTDLTNGYVCTDFAQEILKLIGKSLEIYLPSLSVKESINKLENYLFTTPVGENPSAGAYIFYKQYNDGTGHTGFVIFDLDGKATILHNGSSPNGIKGVNKWNRDLDTDFDLWFGLEETKNRVKYQPIDLWK
jgi:hypothetical protein